MDFPAARAAAVPAVVHLDHAEDVDLIRQAVALGVSSVMYDGSKLDYAANVAATAEVVREAHAAVDRNTILLDDQFLVGGAMLRYPADPMSSDLSLRPGISRSTYMRLRAVRGLNTTARTILINNAARRMRSV